VSAAGGLSVVTTVGTFGTSADVPMPGGSAVVATLRTAIAGRRYRGRIYTGGLSEDANNGGTVDPLQATAIEAAWQDLVDNLAAVSNFEVVVASFGGVAPGPTWTPFATPVTQVQVNTQWDSQRRRNR
jgi:hypothetical protein